jgi:hypothetical protein
MGQSRESISRILAVGGPSEDGIHRMTKGESFVCCEGSDAEHRELADFCQNVEQLLQATGQDLQDFTPEEFSEWVKAFVPRKEKP